MKGTAIGIIALAMTVSATPAMAWERISDEDALAERVVGRTLVNEAGSSWVVRANGRIEGNWDGQAMTGIWEWHSGLFCRNVVVGGQQSGTDCQVLEVRGDSLRVIRDQGRGETSVVTIR